MKGTSDRRVPEPDPLPPVVCAQALDAIHIQVSLSSQTVELSVLSRAVRASAGHVALVLKLLTVERVAKRLEGALRDRESHSAHKIGKIPAPALPYFYRSIGRTIGYPVSEPQRQHRKRISYRKDPF